MPADRSLPADFRHRPWISTLDDLEFRVPLHSGRGSLFLSEAGRLSAPSTFAWSIGESDLSRSIIRHPLLPLHFDVGRSCARRTLRRSYPNALLFWRKRSRRTSYLGDAIAAAGVCRFHMHPATTARGDWMRAPRAGARRVKLWDAPRPWFAQA